MPGGSSRANWSARFDAYQSESRSASSRLKPAYPGASVSSACRKLAGGAALPRGSRESVRRATARCAGGRPNSRKLVTMPKRRRCIDREPGAAAPAGRARRRRPGCRAKAPAARRAARGTRRDSPRPPAGSADGMRHARTNKHIGALPAAGSAGSAPNQPSMSRAEIAPAGGSAGCPAARSARVNQRASSSSPSRSVISCGARHGAKPQHQRGGERPGL